LNDGFTISFEGPLPRFGAVSSALYVASGAPNPDMPDGVYDTTGRYCDGGVQSWQALVDAGRSEAEADDLADRLQIATSLAIETDNYWVSVKKVADNTPDPDDGCTFEICRAAFGDGTETVLSTARDFTITEAYQDHVLLADHGVTNESGATIASGLKLA